MLNHVWSGCWEGFRIDSAADATLSHTAIFKSSKASPPLRKPSHLSVPQEALDNLMLDGDNIVSAARRAIMRHDYSAVLTIFPILRHLKMNKSEFDSTLQVGLLSAPRAPTRTIDNVCCASAGHGGQHQEQAAHAHHLHGDDRSQGSGGVRRQHQGQQELPTLFLLPSCSNPPDHQGSGTFLTQGAMKAKYLEMCFSESHTIILQTEFN